MSIAFVLAVVTASVPKNVLFAVFSGLADHISNQDELAQHLADSEVVVLMRERTPFPESLLTRLPTLRLLVTTGMHNAAIDLAAAERQGITVCGTIGGVRICVQVCGTIRF